MVTGAARAVACKKTKAIKSNINLFMKGLDGGQYEKDFGWDGLLHPK
jgi:hypothetical protein